MYSESGNKVKETQEQSVDYWYRYNDTISADHPDKTLIIKATRFQVLLKNPSGVRLKVGDGVKFVSFNQKKKFAHPSLEQAFKSFIKRKENQLQILGHQVRRAQLAKQKMEELDIESGVIEG